MVNRKREPWWNRKAETAAAAVVSRRSKLSVGQQRLSTSNNSLTLNESPSASDSVHRNSFGHQYNLQSSASGLNAGNASIEADGESCNSVECPNTTPTRDENDRWGNATPTRDEETKQETATPVKYFLERRDATPTRDEDTEWRAVASTCDVDFRQETEKQGYELWVEKSIGYEGCDQRSASLVKENTGMDATLSTEGYIVDQELQSLSTTIGEASSSEMTDIASCTGSSVREVDVDKGSDREAEDADLFYGPEMPSVLSTTSTEGTVEEIIISDTDLSSSEENNIHKEIEKSCVESRKKKKKQSKKCGSTNSFSSEKSFTRETSPSPKRSHRKKRRRHSSGSSSVSEKSAKKSKSPSRDRERSPRRPRKLAVAYDKLRAKNGTALPLRTYDPLRPFGMRSSSTKSHSSRNCDKGTRSSSKELQTKSSQSSYEDDDNNAFKGKKLSTSSPSDKRSTTGVKTFASSPGSRQSSKVDKTKSVYSNRKRTAGKKSDTKSNDQNNWMNLNAADGIGLQKIRPSQRRMFMATCVEEYSLQTNGSMADGLKCLLAFKVGNPQFVSEFYEKKTELESMPLTETNAVKYMKEKFAFKVKIGIDKLDTFITDGITVDGQNAFFSKHYREDLGPSHLARTKNAMLLYRYADICLAWTMSKNFCKSTPIFLLIHKVVYGRTKMYNHIGEAQYIKGSHNCDCLKSSLVDISKTYGDDSGSVIRKGLNCSKVIIADFDTNGGFRQRPRQILPYAFVLYGREDLTDDEEADMKQSVLAWKKRFEAHRWNMASQEVAEKQILVQQQQAQLAMHASLLPFPPDVGGPQGMPPGMPMGMNPGMVPNMPMGMNPGMGPNMPMGMNPGIGPNIPMGMNSGMGPNMPMGMNPGMGPNMPMVMNPIMGSTMPMGMNPGMGPNMPVGMSMGMGPGIPMGIPPGMGPGNPEGGVPPWQRMDNGPCNLNGPGISPSPVREEYVPRNEQNNNEVISSASMSDNNSIVHPQFKKDDNNISSTPPIQSPVSTETTQYESDIGKKVAEALATHRRSLETRDVGIQAKMHPTIISLQKKSVSLSASTQTPDLDTDDSYEASLLRGGPLKPPQTSLCSRCESSHEPDGADTEDSSGTLTARIFINKRERQREYETLSSRFGGIDNNMDDLLLDDDEARSSQPVT